MAVMFLRKPEQKMRATHRQRPRRFRSLVYEQFEARLPLALGDLLATLDDPGMSPQANALFGASVAIEGGITVIGAPTTIVAGRTVGAVYLVDSSTGNILRTLANPGQSINFGNAVAISGNIVVVGCDQFSLGQGAVYVFDASSGNLLKTFNNPTPAFSDSFGKTVAISGNRILVGAPGDDTTATNSGSAYLFDATTGDLLQTLANPTPAANEAFGTAIAISDGTIVIGVSGDSTGATGAGSAYLFNTSGTLLRTLNNPSSAADDAFGNTVAVSGSTVWVGAVFDDTSGVDSGSVYSFDVTTGSLLRTFNNPTPATKAFGLLVKISGNRIAVTAAGDTVNPGMIHLLDAVTGDLIKTLNNPTLKSQDNFGSALGIAGSTVMVGASLDDTFVSDGGAAYLFQADTGDLIRTLKNPGGATNDQFGHSVAANQNTVVVGAPFDDTGGTDAGAAYVYDTAGNLRFTLRKPIPAANDLFGASVAVFGNIAVVGCPTDESLPSKPNAVYLFDTTNGNLLRKLDDPNPMAGDLFGAAVAISGTTVVVGAGADDTGVINAGLAYVFNATTGALLRTLNNPSPLSAGQFGGAVAIDGNTIVVGAAQTFSTSLSGGVAYIFDATTGSLLKTLNNPTPAGGDAFGGSVGVSGQNVVVGAANDDTGANDSGAAYVFDAVNGNLLWTLNNPSPKRTALFGYATGISGSMIVAGALLDDTAGPGSGTVYFFDADTGGLMHTKTDPFPDDSGMGSIGTDSFGRAVAISGSTVVSGAPLENGASIDRGAAYILSGEGSTSIFLDGTGNLVVKDSSSAGKSDNLTISFDGTNYTIRDTTAPSPNTFVITGITEATGGGTATVTIPAGSIPGSKLIVNTGSGSDTLNLDLSTANPLRSGGLTFNAGGQAADSDDKLIITSGGQGVVTYSYTGTRVGSVAMGNFGAINYTGLDSIVNTGVATNVSFNLPASASAVTFGDDGTNGNTLSRLSAATIGQIDFANPTGSLTINRGNAADTLTINALPDFTAGLTIGSTGIDFSAVTFPGPLNLATSKILSVFAGTISTSAPISTSGGGVTFNATNGITLNNALNTNGGDIALNADINSDGNGTLTLSGVATTYIEQSRLTAADGAAQDQFGVAVSLSSDGNTAVVGGWLDDVGTNSNQGSAYIFTRAGNVWTQQQQLNGLNGPSSNFGSSVAISADGSTAFIGASGEAGFQGAVYVFTRSGGVWTQQQRLTATNGASGDHFGFSTALSSHGNTVIIGALLDNVAANSDQGSAYIFTRVGGVWTQQQQLTAADGAADDQFGYKVALSSDGNTALVGARADRVLSNSGQGSACVFTRAGGLWTQQQQLTATGGAAGDKFGTVALSGDGNTAVIGAYGADGDRGSAYVFTREDSVWTQQQQLTAATRKVDDYFGVSVALTSDGNMAIVGTFEDNANHGSAYVFTRNEGIWSQQQRIIASDGAVSDLFGYSVAVSSDGNTTLVGAAVDDVGTNVDQGSASTFVRSLISPGGSLAAGGGNVTITAADADIQGTILGASSVSITVAQSGRPIDLGTNTAGSLGLTDPELDRIPAATLSIGNALSGAITVSAKITRPAATAMALTSGGAIHVGGGAVNTAGGDLLLSPGGTASMTAAQMGNDVNLGATGVLSFAGGSTLAIQINHSAPSQQLDVIGQVDLTGTNLSLNTVDPPSAGDSFVLVNNDGADAITSTFSGRPEGALFTMTFGNVSRAYQITYQGGDGNDVVLKTMAVNDLDLQGTNDDDSWVLKRNAGNVDFTLNGNLVGSSAFVFLNSIRINGLAGRDTLTIDLTAGSVIRSGGISFDGGDPVIAPGDKLVITGGNQGTVTYNYTNAHDGSIMMSAFLGTVSYTGLEPIVNSGRVADLILNLPATASQAVLEDDGDIGNGLLRLRSGNGTFETTDFANPTNSLTINRGNPSDTILVSTITDFTAGLTIGSIGNELSTVTFAGGITFAANNSLSASATGTISLQNATSDLATSGTGTIALTTAKNIVLAEGSSIKSVDGAITLSANLASTTTGSFIGVDINNGLVEATGVGVVSVTGKGGDGTGGSQIGVRVRGGGDIVGGISGTLIVSGTGGTSVGDTNYGVAVTGFGSTITSGGANVQLSGQGGGSGSSASNYGVNLQSSGQLTAGGSGSVTVQGTGGAGSGRAQVGVFIAIDAAITSNGGNINVTGQGGGSGTSVNNIGVDIESNGRVSAGGSGSVTVQGTGGSSSGEFQIGVLIIGSTITSSGGNVQVTGLGGGSGTSANSYGIDLQSGGQVTAGGNGMVNVSGTGSAAFGNSQAGVLVTGTGSQITSSGGNVQVVGQGGGSGSSAANMGVNVQLNGVVSAGGSGTVTVQGTGGPSSGNGQLGIRVSDTGSKITSNGGNVQVTGIGGGSGTSDTNYGVIVQKDAQVTTGGSGTITVQGTGGSTIGNANGGVVVSNGTAKITSSGGNVKVIGIGGGIGTSIGNEGVRIQATGQVTAGGNGTVIVEGTGGVGGLSHGVNLSNGTITSSGGNVQITGQGGGLGAVTVSFGVIVGSAAVVTAGGNGTVTVHGAGGVATADFQEGVHITGSGSQITSSGGHVLVIGQGGGSGTSASNSGVVIQSSGQITASGSGTVTIQGTGGAASGDGQSGVRVSGAGSQITSSGGNVQITGQGGGSGTSGNNQGVVVQTDGQVTAGGSGTVTVQGTGGASSGNTSAGVLVIEGTAKITSSGGNVRVTGLGGGTGGSGGNDGVHLQDSVQVTAGGSGTVTVEGTGGVGDLSHGVNISKNATVTSSGGNVQITGQGGGSATTSDNNGVLVTSASQVTAGSNGTVLIQGTGGSGSGGSSNGVVVRNSAMVTSGGGSVQITGLGGGTGASRDNIGVLATLAGQITAGGLGKITLQGTGGAGTGDGNYGICIDGSATISTSGGSILATGIEGTGTSGLAIRVGEGATISATATDGTLTFIGNSLNFVGASAIVAGSGVTLRPFTSGIGIDLGLATDPVGGPLGLADAEFNVITAGTINIGDTNSGPITISEDITRSATTSIALTTGGAIHFTTGSLNTAGGNLKLTSASTDSVSVANPNTEITVDAGTLSFTSDSNLSISINGPATGQPGSYDQLTVFGNVDLTGVSFQLSGATPAIGDEFTIVNNVLAEGLTTGEFNELPQDEIFTVTNGSFAGSFKITYHGGDGNDVVLTAVNIPPSFDHLAGDYSAADENPATRGPALEQIVLGWATNITVGPAHESNQKPTFIIHTDNPDLFAVPPAIDCVTGTLTYTPAPNKHGTAHVTVVLQDDGGGTNTSPEVSFNIVITKTHRLHNAAELGERNGLDVTGSTSSAPDGFVVSADVLAVINYINANGSGSILDSNTSAPPYPDVDADDQVVAQDVLKIINYINAHPGRTEGEATEPSQIEASDLITLLALDIAEQAPRRRRQL